MERLKKTILTVLWLLGMFSAVHAAETKMMMPFYPGMGGYMYGMWGGNYGYGHFEVADLDLDGINEIIFLRGDTLTVLDNQGALLFTKTVEGLDSYSWYSGSRAARQGRGPGYGGGYHMGPWTGNPGDGSTEAWEEIWEAMPMFSGGMMGAGHFEVANLDGDDNPEIIIRNLDTLIVLDHNGDPESTITIPDIN